MQLFNFGQPRLRFVESFRQLAITLRALEKEQRLQTIVLLSAYPREGRTTLTANLGIALAEGGNRVLLADADLRRAELGKMLSLTPQPLLNEALERGCLMPPTTKADGSPDDPPDRETPTDQPEPGIGQAASVSGLRVLTAAALERGRPLPNLSGLIPMLRAAPFDYVLIDTPACRTYAEGFQLAAQADGVLYVVRRRRHDKETHERILAQLRQVGANLLGVVFNAG